MVKWREWCSTASLLVAAVLPPGPVLGCAKAGIDTETKQEPAISSEPPARKQPVLGTVRLVGYPDGTSLVADGRACSVARVTQDRTKTWTRRIRGCGGVLSVAVAPDSHAYVRTNDSLLAFSSEGRQLWVARLASVPPFLRTPAVTLDSLVAVASSTRSLVAFRPDGIKVWTLEIGGGETILGAPTGSETEGVAIVSTAAVYSVAHDGTIRWRSVLPFTPSRR